MTRGYLIHTCKQMNTCHSCTVLLLVSSVLASPVLLPDKEAAAVLPEKEAAADMEAAAAAEQQREKEAPVTAEEKNVAEAASVAADKMVSTLETQRDEAWQTARGNLAVASHPPIRSSAVLGLLTAETDKVNVDAAPISSASHNTLFWHSPAHVIFIRLSQFAVCHSHVLSSAAYDSLLCRSPPAQFAQLEASIKKAKAEAAHQRRLAELAGGAWDALESKKLKGLRVTAAEAALTAAREAEVKMGAKEAELLRELAIERQRSV